MTDTTTRAGVRRVPLDDITPHPDNPKAHDLDAIAASIRRFGFVEPVVVDQRTGLNVSGHGRVEALQAMRDRGDTPPDGIGADWKAPVYTGWASADDDEAGAALIALNRAGERGGWHDQPLLDLLDRISDTDTGLDGVGFDGGEVDELRGRLAAMDAPDPWKDRRFQGIPDADGVQVGDVYRVGPHLVACGDSRDPALWARLLRDEEPTMVFTDPPYGIDYGGGGGVERAALEGDTASEAPTLLAAVLDTIGGHMRPGAASYVCLPSGDVLPAFAAVLAERGLWRWALAWVKDHATFGRADYHQQHELIVYGWWPNGPRLCPVADRGETTVWEVPRPSDSDRHPTAKPVELAARAVRNSTEPGWLVVDPFAGSFSTLVACHQEGRIGVAVEGEAGYVAEGLRWLSTEVGVAPEKLVAEPVGQD